MQAELNERLSRIGPGTPCGELMRRYWQPAALLDEVKPQHDPRLHQRPLKAVRLPGQDLVLFKTDAGQWGQLDRDCPHRGADLSFARFEGDGIRCPFYGWKFAADSRCLETPAEPAVNGQPSRLCARVRQRSGPVLERSGVLWAYLGPQDMPPPRTARLRRLQRTRQPQLRFLRPVALQLAAGHGSGLRPDAAQLSAPLFA